MDVSRRRRAVFLASLSVWLAGAAGLLRAQGSPTPAPAASPAARPVTILFVGNSFLHGKYLPVRSYNAAGITDENFGVPRPEPRAEIAEPGPYGGIPGIFKKLADEAGVPCDVHLEAISARTLEYHHEHALDFIARARWDVVVLQEYSTRPLPENRGGKPGLFFKYATALEQAVHTSNPKARVYLYETWPRADLTFSGKGPYSGEGIEAMLHDLHEAYYRESVDDKRFEGVAPVGDAWGRAIAAGLARSNPADPRQADRLDLWGEDDYHPSVQGAYLAALVVFEQITGKDARGPWKNEQAAADLGIPAAQAASLQQVAHDQVNAGKPPAPAPLN